MGHPEQQIVWRDRQGEPLAAGWQPGFLLPGSFNPLHQGHLSLFQTAAEVLGREGAFELTTVNADKPPLDEPEVLRRLGSFRGVAPVVVTRARTFVDKAHLFPGTVFVVGADTAARIIEPRFYGGCSAAMRSAQDQVRQQGCSFLVAGRVNAAGQFLCLHDLAIPETLRDLFHPIPAERFRIDLSSTQLRQQSQIGL